MGYEWGRITLRIGIITCWASRDNYGQQLQCWALQEKLKQLGHSPYLIRYKRSPKRKGLFKRLLSMPPRKIATKLLIRLVPSKRKMETARKQAVDYALSHSSDRAFETFQAQNLEVSERCYTSISELRSDPPLADAYITGSDQVWYDPLDNADIDGMYLSFGDDDIKRIAYAVSIGRDILDSEIAHFSELVRRLDFVSVREASAKETCGSVGVDASITADPTLLLDARTYERLVEKSDACPPNDEYMFAYVINVENADEFRWQEIEEYADASRLPIRAAYSSGYYPAYELLPEVPGDYLTIPAWLAFIHDASCVVTSSYHGVVFAILFHRPFVSIPLNKEHSRANDRVSELLARLELSDRMLVGDRSLQDIMDTPIDWQDVERRLEVFRRASTDYLLEAMGAK